MSAGAQNAAGLVDVSHHFKGRGVACDVEQRPETTANKHCRICVRIELIRAERIVGLLSELFEFDRVQLPRFPEWSAGELLGGIHKFLLVTRRRVGKRAGRPGMLPR